MCPEKDLGMELHTAATLLDRRMNSRISFTPATNVW